MTIVQINAVYGKGSTGKTTMELHRHLLAQGHDSHVLWAAGCSHAEDANLHRIGNAFGAKIHAVATRLFGTQCFHSRFSTGRTVRLLKRLRPDVVHLHNLHSNYIHLPTLLKCLAKADVPVVMTLHDCWFFTGGCFHFKLLGCDGYTKDCKGCPALRGTCKRTVRARLFQKKKRLYAALSRIAVMGVSGWVSDSARASALFGDNVRHGYVYNWIDLETFRPMDDGEKIREQYGLSPDDKIILGVAQSWRSDKGVELFRRLSERVDGHTKIVLVGAAQGRESTDTLRFVGRTENASVLASLYSTAHVFVNPSPAETFGLVTVEAMACGAAVVAYNNTGTAELLRDPRCGTLVADGDEDAMIEAVLAAVEKDTAPERAARRAYVENNFSSERQMEQYVCLYKELCENTN